MIKIIGIDPGLAATGVGIARGTSLEVESYSFGSIHTSAQLSLPNRLDHIYSKLLRLLKDEKPDLMVIEDVFSLEKYPKSGITLGKVCGVVLLASRRAGVSSTEIPVRTVKQALTGNGGASKIQLEAAVRNFLNLKVPIRPYHASDAMALALMGLLRYETHLLQKKAEAVKDVI
jgi:crossover junction endodeoxyribonuclease RuvC